MKRVALSLLVLTAGCKDTGAVAPVLSAVAPTQGVAGARTPVRIAGHFAVAVRANFDDEDRSRIATEFGAWLGEQPLEDVTYVSPTALTATVPAGLSPGRYALTVTDPRGERGTLPDAFTVLSADSGVRDGGADLGPDLGPEASVPDLAPDGPPDAGPDVQAPDLAPPKGVFTIAGSGVAGYADGLASQAQFAKPRGIALLGSTILVADYENYRLRQIDGDQVTTFAGCGVQGLADGPAGSAELNLPDGIAVDAAGTVYVADSANSCIRKIEGGVVSTLAGTNTAGLVDGALAAARFTNPRGIAVDGGKIYVADTGNHRIRLIEGGTVSTLAGSVAGHADGAALSARFSAPMGLAVDGGKIYVADSGNNRIRVIEAGIVSTVAGAGAQGKDDGPALQATFWSPVDLACAGTTIYVVDQANHAIRAFDGANVTTLNGAGFGHRDGPLATALFFYPRGIVAGPGGELYVADQSNERIRLIRF